MRRRGATILELLLASTIIAIAGAACLPVMASVADGYSAAAETRRISDQAGFAMDRVVRLLREVDIDVDSDELAFAVATATEFRFDDGRGIRFDGERLLLRTADGSEAFLLENVDQFDIGYFSEDGVTDSLGDPPDASRFSVFLRVSGLEFRAVVFPRVRAR